MPFDRLMALSKIEGQGDKDAPTEVYRAVHRKGKRPQTTRLRRVYTADFSAGIVMDDTLLMEQGNKKLAFYIYFGTRLFHAPVAQVDRAPDS